MRAGITRHYLVACDFDQTLSLNDSGIVLSELIGVSGFQQKVTGLSDIHLVQQGAELAYLLRHDPEFRCVRRAHLVEAGKHVHVEKDIARLLELLADGIDGHRFSFRVISAAPQEIIQSALEGIVPQNISPERSSTTIRPRTKSARSRRCLPDTGRLLCSGSSRRSCRSAPIVSCTSGTAAPMST